jgi:hypothetical protein
MIEVNYFELFLIFLSAFFVFWFIIADRRKACRKCGARYMHKLWQSGHCKNCGNRDKKTIEKMGWK